MQTAEQAVWAHIQSVECDVARSWYKANLLVRGNKDDTAWTVQTGPHATADMSQIFTFE